MKRFWAKVRKSDSCWEWTASTACGYGKMWFRGKCWAAHRISWVLANGEIPDGMFVLHRCDNRLCVSPDHLFIGTHQDNMSDMAKKGRAVVVPKLGSDNPKAKLTEFDVRAIRLMDGTNVAIAKVFGVSDAMISYIRRGKNWKHVGA